VILLLAAAAQWGYWVAYQYRFTTVTKGQVFLAAAMPVAALVETVQEHGIMSVVDLRASHEAPEGLRELQRLTLERMGVTYLYLPSAQVPDPARVSRFLDHAEQQEHRPMLIHCRHGEGRSVLFAAIYRIELEGWSNERARSATRLFPAFSSFDIDRPKGRFLREYRPRGPAPEPAGSD
jgi:protein tyrosine phosphatase (PTP) superfamily phosphohydrolase (DUF442 family)